MNNLPTQELVFTSIKFCHLYYNYQLEPGILSPSHMMYTVLCRPAWSS